MTHVTPPRSATGESLLVLGSGDAIGNPVTGERVVIRVTARESDGERFEAERFLAPDHPRQPEHLHPGQESLITVVRGVAGFKLDRVERMALPGQTLRVPAGAPHELWNAGGDTLHIRFEQRPALDSGERLLLALFALAAEGKTDERGMPGLLQRAVMLPAYADCVRLASPPWLVQRALSGLLRPLARARGLRPFPGESASVRSNTSVSELVL